MEALEQNEPDTDGHAGGFDFEEAAKLCGLSKLQKDFARAILRGANRNLGGAHCRQRGDGVALRSAAHRAYNSPKLQAFLYLAKQDGYGIPDEPATRAS